jgi:type VI secretion system protein ImpA
MSATTYALTAGGEDEGLDLEAMLAPIPGENPAGEDLLYSGLHDEIREARRADELLPAGEWRRENKLANWPRVEALATEALLTRTKDLQVAAWLAEALLQTRGFEGLRDGLKLIRGLELNFWDDLYPTPEDGDADDRAKLLEWLDGKLSLGVVHVPLTDAPGGIGYAYRHWQESREFDVPANVATLSAAEQEKYAEVRARAVQEEKITSEQWRGAQKTTRRAFYEKTAAVLDECWAEFHALADATRELFGPRAPGMGALRKTLEDVRALVGNILARKRVQEPVPVVTSPAAQQSKPADGDGRPAASGETLERAAPQPEAVTSREGAYRKLAEAAAYFRQAEPHSPVPYLIERAIKWGQMPLEDWLAEVVKSEDVLSRVWETLGVGGAQAAAQAESDGGEEEES